MCDEHNILGWPYICVFLGDFAQLHWFFEEALGSKTSSDNQ